ncbi:glycosyltransferase involved in cell wall biosynthesis [Humitalea rosea]|uniref:Glycosyltransferase involved in cell wall biosynthesis n=1 Tax=Humitalea rosea TaxID=990373 RepID=A0A2W7IQQ5_9PROT|nr:glycosyltransferase family 4 protein [Humitalea rosea]PZW48633.1 glycosyltransferase involved in cell wall biosynthesis [Humitalea rosea]
MRILILSNLYPPNVIGGYERLCHQVASDLVRRGHEVVVLTSRYGGKVADYPGQTILRELDLLTGPDIYTPFAGTAEDRAAIGRASLATLQRVLDEVRPDVIFAWNLFFLDSSLLTALENGPYRTIVMLTDNWLLVMRNPHFVSDFFRDVVHGQTPFIVPRPAPAWRRLARRIRRALAPATPASPPLEAIFGSGFMRDFYAAGGSAFARHAVIHNGVSLPPQESFVVPDRRRLVEPGTLRLLFAGRLVDLKGAHTAVEALSLLDPAALGVDRILLTVVGDSQDAAYMRSFEDAIARSGRAEDIVMAPTVGEHELPQLFAAHDLYIFPSLYEPFSLTLIHALACGIPTIATRIGGNPEIVQDGQSGLLFDKGDAQDLARGISRLATDAALRRRLSDGGQAAGRAFTFERMVGEMERVLTDRP